MKATLKAQKNFVQWIGQGSRGKKDKGIERLKDLCNAIIVVGSNLNLIEFFVLLPLASIKFFLFFNYDKTRDTLLLAEENLFETKR